MGLWRSWERARLAVLRSRVRPPSAPPFFMITYKICSFRFIHRVPFLARGKTSSFRGPFLGLPALTLLPKTLSIFLARLSPGRPSLLAGHVNPETRETEPAPGRCSRLFQTFTPKIREASSGLTSSRISALLMLAPDRTKLMESCKRFLNTRGFTGRDAPTSFQKNNSGGAFFRMV